MKPLIIKEKALAWCVAYAEVDEIEEINILNAALVSMNRAINGLKVKAEFALIDGNKNMNIETPSVPVIDGDALCPSIAAASILAKVSRDRYCKEVLAKEYPEYQFEKHKGYGTKLHFEKIVEYGPCPEHRLSFLRKKLGDL